VYQCGDSRLSATLNIRENQNVQYISSSDNAPALSRQQTHFDSNPVQEHITAILTKLRAERRLNGLILYVSDYSGQQLHLRSFSTRMTLNEEKKAEIRKTALPFETSEKQSFAAHVFNQRQPQYSADSNSDPLFDPETLQKVGVYGAAYGVPIRVGHRVFGVLIAWFEPSDFSTELDLELQLSCNVLATLIEKANRDHFKFLSLVYLSELIHLVVHQKSAESVVECAVQCIGFAGLERVRVFGYDRSTEWFDLLRAHDLSGETSYEPGPLGQYRPSENPYTDFFFKFCGLDRSEEFDPSQSNQQHAFLFRSDNFGVDPNGDRFDRPNDLPWIVAPMLSSNGLLGYVSGDNRLNRQSIRSETVAYLQAATWLTSIALANSDERKSFDISIFNRFVEPLFNSAAHGSPVKSRFGLYESEEDGPTYFGSPDFVKIKSIIDDDGRFALTKNKYNSENISEMSEIELLVDVLSATHSQVEAEGAGPIRVTFRVEAENRNLLATVCNSLVSRDGLGPAEYGQRADELRLGFSTRANLVEFAGRAKNLEKVFDEAASNPELQEALLGGVLDVAEVQPFIPDDLFGLIKN